MCDESDGVRELCDEKTYTIYLHIDIYCAQEYSMM